MTTKAVLAFLLCAFVWDAGRTVVTMVKPVPYMEVKR